MSTATVSDPVQLYHDFGDGYGPEPAHRHINKDGTLGGWVAESAKVHPTAHVGVDCSVYYHAIVDSYASLYGNVQVSGFVRVRENVHLWGWIQLSGHADFRYSLAISKPTGMHLDSKYDFYVIDSDVFVVIQHINWKRIAITDIPEGADVFYYCD